MHVLDLATLSVVFLSFDETEAESNFAALLRHAPEARRVHGISGFDTAHRHAGAVAESDHVITVDADNRIVEGDFFTRRYQFGAAARASVISFGARLAHNGLVYGNGGIKIWPRIMLRTLRTHEHSRDGGNSVDFAGQVPYVQAQGAPSESVVTATPSQAFRAGYREGSRLALANRVLPYEAHPDLALDKAFHTHLPKGNLERLQVWCTVGRHVENGDWAIFGARLGCLHTNVDRMPLSRIANHNWIAQFWDQTLRGGQIAPKEREERMSSVRELLKDRLDLQLEELDAADSAAAVAAYTPRRRIGALWTT